MENRKIPALIALVGVIVAVVLFFLLNDDTADEATELGPAENQAAISGGDKGPDTPEEPAEPEVPTIEIEGGEPVGGVQELEFTAGGEIRIRIVSDVTDELHLHAYDEYVDVEAGTPTDLVVDDADIEGTVELESHTTGTLFAEISVVPS